MFLSWPFTDLPPKWMNYKFNKHLCGLWEQKLEGKYFQQGEYSPAVSAGSSQLGCSNSRVSGDLNSALVIANTRGYATSKLPKKEIGQRNATFQGHPSLHYLWAATGTTTFLSAVSYAFMKDTYKFSHKEYDHQFGKKLFAFILFILFNIGFTLTFPAKVKYNSQLENVFCSANGQEWSGLPCDGRP